MNTEYIKYKGKGEHSVSTLEKIIEQREELHILKSSELLKQRDELQAVLTDSFVQRMQKEIKENEHKGDWTEFAVKENRPEILREIEHHYNKLALAYESDDEELIREHSADIGNIAMFMFKSTEVKP